MRALVQVFNRPYWNVNRDGRVYKVVSSYVFNRPYWNVNRKSRRRRPLRTAVFNRPYWNVNILGLLFPHLNALSLIVHIGM